MAIAASSLLNIAAPAAAPASGAAAPAGLIIGGEAGAQAGSDGAALPFSNVIESALASEVEVQTLVATQAKATNALIAALAKDAPKGELTITVEGEESLLPENMADLLGGDAQADVEVEAGAADPTLDPLAEEEAIAALLPPMPVAQDPAVAVAGSDIAIGETASVLAGGAAGDTLLASATPPTEASANSTTDTDAAVSAGFDALLADATATDGELAPVADNAIANVKATLSQTTQVAAPATTEQLEAEATISQNNAAVTAAAQARQPAQAAVANSIAQTTMAAAVELAKPATTSKTMEATPTQQAAQAVAETMAKEPEVKQEAVTERPLAAARNGHKAHAKVEAEPLAEAAHKPAQDHSINADAGGEQPVSTTHVSPHVAVSQPSHATTHAQLAASLPGHATRSASEQVEVSIQRAVEQGDDRILIQLDPAELGRVEIRMHVAQDGAAQIIITADKRDTLDMLKQDARSLERALQDAGIKADAGEMQFNHKQNSELAAQMQQQEQRDRNANARNGEDTIRGAIGHTAEESLAASLNTTSSHYTLAVASGLDIRV